MIDLFCGVGGWAFGGLSEGYDVVGFDIECHQYGPHRFPAQLVLQDVLTLHGSQFRDAALIVASPPCQAYSWMAMPWSRAKAKAAEIRADETGRMLADLNRLFDACFRIQAQASLAAGRHIPLVVENVRGAQPWVGRARWNFGSFYLWGDVPALMPFTADKLKGGQTNWRDHDKPGYRGQQLQDHFALKLPGFRFDGSGRSFQTVRHPNICDGFNHIRHLTNPAEHKGIKQHGSGDAWWDKALDERRREATAIKNGHDWFSSGADCSLQRRASSGSSARKAASALIAKIPLPLAQYIARTYHNG